MDKLCGGQKHNKLSLESSNNNNLTTDKVTVTKRKDAANKVYRPATPIQKNGTTTSERHDKQKVDDESDIKHLHRHGSRERPLAKATRLAIMAQIGEDWLYLALLGIIMALISFSMDTIISLFLNTRLWMFKDLSEDNRLIQYLGWCLTPIILVTFSSGFVHLCSPTAIGSGIPEMKTILRGVVLNEYLTFRTLIAKIVGLTFTLGSGLPLGKEGPFVHMASIVATLLSKLVASFQGIYENESRTSEMLSAACAVGVAATFYAPIGGVLFSIEVTTVYFAVRNYWRGFFAACCGATIWRLLCFWIKNDESISALFKTDFRNDFPFDPIELLVFSFIGATCGLAGAGYIKFHRVIVQFFRRHERLSNFLQQNRFIYPIFVTLIITTVTFPPLIGKYTASTLSTHTTIEHLFSNRTWSLGNQDLVSKQILEEWSTPDTNFYFHLILYIVMLFWTSALASTIPIPSGLFIPVLKMGAAYGRLLGELMHLAFPEGIKYGDYIHPASIVPGSYAVVGAAAFSGAVTHTISTSVILFEMTGQIVHIIPVILGVLISNAVCQSLQPSIYDSIIEIKKLPYLPPIASSNSVSHKILVKDFMNTNLAFVWKERCTYSDLKSLLSNHKKIVAFPLVESGDSMKLLGSVPRADLLKLLYLHLGRERRLQEVSRRSSDTRAPTLLSTVCDRIDLHKLSDLALPCAGLEDASREQRVSEDRGLEFDARSELNEVDRKSSSSPNGETASPRSCDKAASYGSITQPNPKSIIHESSSSASSTCSNNEDADETQNDGCQVAKSIDHYNRGSLIDADQIEGWARQMEVKMKRGIKKVVTAPEVRLELGPAMFVRSPVNGQQNRPCSPIAELRKQESSFNLTTSFNNSNNNNNNNNSNSTTGIKPKSILKTSSTVGSFSNIYNKRNISSQSFTSQLGTSSPLDSKMGAAYASNGRGAKRPMILVGVGPNHIAKSQQSVRLSLDSSQDPNLSLDFTQQTSATPVTRPRRKVKLPRLRVVDMTLEEQEQWEREQLNVHIDISKCQVDEAPFQLVEQTSLYRVHTLFSMLGLNHAYVTSFGRLVGVVALKDIRYAIEKMLQEK